MKLNVQKRIAASLLRCSQKRVKFDPERLEDIKEAITKADMRGLINMGAVYIIPKKGVSKVRARKRKKQRRKGRQKGYGTRKGKKTARLPGKKKWMNRVRIQRELIKKLRNGKKITKKAYRDLYSKISGGFFRSKRHLRLHIEEHELIKK